MERLQLIFSAVAGAGLVGYVAAGGFNRTFLTVAVAALAVFIAAGMLVDRWLARRTPRGAPAVTPQETALRRLDLPEARRRALELLANPAKFRVVAGPGVVPGGISLPPAVGDLFSRFAKVQMEYGDLVLDASTLAPSKVHRGFTAIGSDVAHSEVLVRPDGETVYVADPDERNVKTFEHYPSVYHLLVCNAAVVYPETS